MHVASASSPVDVACTAGDVVTVKMDGSIRFDDTDARYDVGWYVATDGGDALDGTCKSYGLVAGGDYKVADASGSAVGKVIWSAAEGGNGDECGDISYDANVDGASLDIPIFVDLALKCADENEDGLLDVAICFTWKKECGDNGTCSLEAIIPTTATTGCFCTRVDIDNTSVTIPTKDQVAPC